MKTKEYFDQTADEYLAAYDRQDDLRSFIFSERKRIVFELFDAPGGTVLDIGCGPGVFTDRLSQLKCRTYGVDLSQKMAALAQNRGFPLSIFMVGGIIQLPFKDSSFDSVLCSGVLEYLTDVEPAIKEMFRVLKPGGRLIVTFPNKSSWLNLLDQFSRRLIRFLQRLNLPVEKHINPDYSPGYLSPRRLNRLLNQNGFVVEAVKFHIFRLTLLNKISPDCSLKLARRMNFVRGRFLGINAVVRARRIK